jgi:hypothetical protein
MKERQGRERTKGSRTQARLCFSIKVKLDERVERVERERLCCLVVDNTLQKMARVDLARKLVFGDVLGEFSALLDLSFRRCWISGHARSISCLRASSIACRASSYLAKRDSSSDGSASASPSSLQAPKVTPDGQRSRGATVGPCTLRRQRRRAQRRGRFTLPPCGQVGVREP